MRLTRRASTAAVPGAGASSSARRDTAPRRSRARRFSRTRAVGAIVLPGVALWVGIGARY